MGNNAFRGGFEQHRWLERLAVDEHAALPYQQLTDDSDEDGDTDEHPDEDAMDDVDDDAGAEQGDDDDADEDPDEHDGRPQAASVESWEVILAERDEAGQWSTVGEAIDDARFESIGLAYAYAETRNKRQFSHRWDWTLDPDRAWVAVPVGHRGRLRGNGRVERVECTMATVLLANTSTGEIS